MERERVKIDMPKYTWEAIKMLIADAKQHFPKMTHDPNFTRLAIATEYVANRTTDETEIAVHEYWRRKD